MSTSWRSSSPVVYVSLFEMRMYCNWLTDEAGGTTFAYSADGSVPLYTHAELAVTLAGTASWSAWFRQDEWFKAAYDDVEDSSYSLYSTALNSNPCEGDFNFGSEGWNFEPVGYRESEQNGT